MKKFLLSIAALAITASAVAFPKALYVKKGDTFTKYNFGVAGDLQFSDNGRTLTITGYNEAINLDNIDYITFTAPTSSVSLTPDAQKDKLLAIGREATAMIDLNKNAGVLNLFHQFTYGYEDENYNWHSAPSEFYISPEYWDVHNAFQGSVDDVNEMAHGNASAIRSLRTKMVDLYKLSDYFGVFTANYDTETWDRTADADYLEINFTGRDSVKYSARLEGSAGYSTWNTEDFNMQLPTTLTLTLFSNGQSVAKVVVDSKLVQNQSMDFNTRAELNGIVATDIMNVTNDAITDKATVTIDGKTFVTANSTILGKNLVNYESIKTDIENGHSHDQYGDCINDPHGLLSHFIRANSDVDLLGKLQVKGKIFGLTKIYDALEEDSYIYDRLVDGDRSTYSNGKILSRNGDTFEVTSEEKSINERHVKYLNNYTDVTFHYDGEAQAQGYLTWYVNEEIDDWYPYTDDYNGYIIKDGHLISVRRDYIGSEDVNGDWVEKYSDWQYSYDIEGPDGNYEYGNQSVDESELVNVEALRKVYYNDTPILTFPDLTNFSFPDFFDNVSFKNLIDDYNDIINTYLSITGQERDEY